MSRRFAFEGFSTQGNLEQRLSLSRMFYLIPDGQPAPDDDPAPLPEPDPGPLPTDEPPIVFPPLPPSGPVGPG